MHHAMMLESKGGIRISGERVVCFFFVGNFGLALSDGGPTSRFAEKVRGAWEETALVLVGQTERKQREREERERERRKKTQQGPGGWLVGDAVLVNVF